MRRPDGYVKVLDFGIAKLTERDRGAIDADTPTRTPAQTEAGAVVGTLPYMSPEQARGTAVDHGRISGALAVCFTKCSPGMSRSRATTTDLLVAIVDREPAPIAPRTEVPAEVDWIIAKTLRKSPADRSQTTEELLGDLRRLLQKLERESHQQRLGSPHSRACATHACPTWAPRVLARRCRLRRCGSDRGTARLGVVLATERNPSVGRGSLACRSPPQVARCRRALSRARHCRRRDQEDEPDRPTDRAADERDSPLRHRRHGCVDRGTPVEPRRRPGGQRPTRRRAIARERESLARVRWRVDLGRQLRGAHDRHLRDSGYGRAAGRVAFAPRARPLAAGAARQAAHGKSGCLRVLPSRVTELRSTDDGGRRSTDNHDRVLRQGHQPDPNFALAHAHLAYVYATNAVFRELPEANLADQARIEIARALALDPELPEIALARSQLLFSRFEGFQTEAAVKFLLAAQKLNPNLGHTDLGYFYTRLGLPDLAERVLQRALEIDPISEFAKAQLLSVYENSGQFDRLFEAHQRFQPNEPVDPWYQVSAGRLDEAQLALDRADKTPATFGRFLQVPSRALLNALRGDVEGAQAAIPSILSRHPEKDPYYHHAAYVIACIHAIAGNSAEAVKWLREAVATGLSTYPLFERTTLLDRVRQAPEFVQFMAELKATTDRYRREFESVRWNAVLARPYQELATKARKARRNLLEDNFRTCE